MARGADLTRPGRAFLAVVVAICAGFLTLTDALERANDLLPGDNTRYAIEDYVTTDPDASPAKVSTWLELVGIRPGKHVILSYRSVDAGAASVLA